MGDFMKKLYALRVAVSLSCLLALPAHSQELSELSMPPNGDNSHAAVSQWIGPVKITIDYHSPNVHGGGGADRTGSHGRRAHRECAIGRSRAARCGQRTGNNGNPDRQRRPVHRQTR